jgi:peptide deformylase
MEAAANDWDSNREHEATVALAAVQIDELYRVVIIRDDFDDHDAPATYHALINPEIVKYEGEIKGDYEGCLSIKQIYGFVPRYERVRVRAINIDGQKIQLKADGFLARVLQHEIDHTNGIVFIDHIKDDEDAFFRLNSEGHLDKLNYDEEIRNSNILW